MGVNRVILISILLALAGCQNVRTTTISPEPVETGQPEMQWVKKGNVLHLQLNKAE